MLSVGEEALKWGAVSFGEGVIVVCANGIGSSVGDVVLVVDGETVAGAKVEGSCVEDEAV